MHRAMQERQYYAVIINAKVLIKLVGLEAKIKTNITSRFLTQLINSIIKI